MIKYKKTKRKRNQETRIKSIIIGLTFLMKIKEWN